MTDTSQIGYGIQTFQNQWNLTYPNASTLRFELTPTENFPDAGNPLASPQSVQRAEINLEQTYAPGTPIEISYNFMVEPGTPTTKGTDWTTIGQMHSESEGAPPFWIDLMPGDHMAIVAAYGNGTQNRVQWNAYVDQSPIERGHTYSIVIDMKLSNDGTGYLHVWRDGTEIVNYNGPIGYGDNTYWKEGVYRAFDPINNQDIAVDYSNLVIKTAAGDGVGVHPSNSTGIEVLPPNPTGSILGVYDVWPTDAGTGTSTSTGTSSGTSTGGTGTVAAGGDTGTGTSTSTGTSSGTSTGGTGT